MNEEKILKEKYDALIAQLDDYKSREYTITKEWDEKIAQAAGNEELVDKLTKGKEKASLAESDNLRPAKRSRKGFVPERITMVALDAPMGEEGETSFGEQLVDPDWEAPLLAVEEQALPRLLTQALAGLNEREQDVLKARFGLSGDAEETLAQLADRYQLSRERIRQIEASALLKLREGPLAGALASLLSA